MAQSTLRDALELINAGRVDEGVHMLRAVASSRDPQALYTLARLTWTGNMVPQDPLRGRLLFEYAAGMGHGPANVLVTNLLASGIAGKRDWSIAIERLAAEGRQLPDRLAALKLVQAMDIDSQGDPRKSPEAIQLSAAPDARIFRGLLTSAECAYLIQVAEPLLQPSVVYNDAGEEVRNPIRTSDGMGFYWLIEDPAIHALNRRVAHATRTSYEQGSRFRSCVTCRVRNIGRTTITSRRSITRAHGRLSSISMTTMRAAPPGSSRPASTCAGAQETSWSLAMLAPMGSEIHSRNMPACQSPRARNTWRRAGFGKAASFPDQTADPRLFNSKKKRRTRRPASPL